MDIFYEPFKAKDSPLALCLGNFDGLHRGHQELILEAKKASEGEVGILLFDKNPALFLANQKSHQVLTSLEDKERLLNSYGLDAAYITHIDESFFHLSPIEFITRVIAPIKPSLLVVGSDYSFGAKASGTPSLLKKYYPTLVVSLLKEKEEKISSQKIIALIEKGQMEEADEMLGRPYEMVGKVVHGQANGRKMGFPTANLALSEAYVLPKSGVYKGVAYSRGMPYPSIINVGTNPTVGELKHPRIEAYLEGLNHEIYGETLYLDFLSFLREEKKFPSLEALEEQLKIDLKSLGKEK